MKCMLGRELEVDQYILYRKSNGRSADSILMGKIVGFTSKMVRVAHITPMGLSTYSRLYLPSNCVLTHLGDSYV